MPFTALLRNIARHVTLEAGEQEMFLSFLTEKTLAKRERVQHEGQPCLSINFVCSGTLRAYFLDLKGRESTIMFAVEDWWITDMAAFIRAQPATLFIEAVSASRIVQLRREPLEELYAAVPKFERFFRIIMQNAYIREQLRVTENLSLAAGERYERFLQKYPQIAGAVTQKQIASYLGVSPEFISQYRAKRGR